MLRSKTAYQRGVADYLDHYRAVDKGDRAELPLPTPPPTVDATDWLRGWNDTWFI